MKTLLLAILMFWQTSVLAVVEYHAFQQPEQERIYQSLISELRCLVCQNQTIADSNADLAKDLRRQVYEMVQQGQSRQQVVDYMTQRYGDFVLYRPAFNLKTGLLWLGPILFLVLGLMALVIFVRNKKATAATHSLSVEQQRRLTDILERGNQD
jgi:cytochrome c-type biogenesis protein CcmH